jgi:DnaK suppressor protein
MDQVKLNQLKQKLELQQRESLEFLSRLEQERRSLEVDSTQDSGDQSVFSLSKESLFEHSSQRRRLLRLIEAALRRIFDGSFGICAACGDDIPLRRLEALPWTQYCLRCQESMERDGTTSRSLATSTATVGTSRRAG